MKDLHNTTLTTTQKDRRALVHLLTDNSDNSDTRYNFLSPDEVEAIESILEQILPPNENPWNLAH